MIDIPFTIHRYMHPAQQHVRRKNLFGRSTVICMLSQVQALQTCHSIHLFSGRHRMPAHILAPGEECASAIHVVVRLSSPFVSCPPREIPASLRDALVTSESEGKTTDQPSRGTGHPRG